MKNLFRKKKARKKKKDVNKVNVQKIVINSILWSAEFSKRLTIVILCIYVVNFILGWIYQFIYHDGTAPMAEVCAELMRVVAECYLIKSGVENVSKGVCKVLYKKWGISENTDEIDDSDYIE